MYQPTSYHDIAPLREITNTKSIDEFNKRIEKLEIPTIRILAKFYSFIKDVPKTEDVLKTTTNARIAIVHSGARVKTKNYIKLHKDHAID